MKQYIIGIGLILVLCFSFLMMNDTNMLIEQKAVLNATAQDMANAAALYFDTGEFMDGRLVIKDAAALSAAYEILKDKYHLNDYSPRSGYFAGDFTCDITIYDDSGLMRKYHNGTFDSSRAFTYYSERYEDIKGIKHTIGDPAVVVEITAEKSKMRLNTLANLELTLKSAALYEHKT